MSRLFTGAASATRGADGGSAVLVDTWGVPKKEIYALWSECRSERGEGAMDGGGAAGDSAEETGAVAGRPMARSRNRTGIQCAPGPSQLQQRDACGDGRNFQVLVQRGQGDMLAQRQRQISRVVNG